MIRLPTIRPRGLVVRATLCLLLSGIAHADWTPDAADPRQVSAALKVYAKLATSADKGAVRDLSQLD